MCYSSQDVSILPHIALCRKLISISILQCFQLWQKWQQGDSDFTAALIGAQIGLAYQEKVFVDNNFLTEKVRNAAESVGLARKKPLIPQSYSFAKVCSTIASAGKTPECHKMQALLLPSERWDTCSAQ